MNLTILAPWLSPISALALLVTRDPTIASDMLLRPSEKERKYVPPASVEGAEGGIEEGRVILGHPDDWGGRDHLSWLSMWAGSQEVVQATLENLVQAIQLGRIKSLARISEKAPYQSVAPEAWAGATLAGSGGNPNQLQVVRFGPNSTRVVAPDLADILVNSADLLAECFSASIVQDSNEIVRTGVAGRPTSIHLISAEHRRRLKSDEAHDSVADESRYLASWLKKEHPFATPATPKTIENRIRAEHRQNHIRTK